MTDPTVTFAVREAQSYEYTATLRDADGAPIPRGALTDLRLTLRRTDGCLAGDAAIVNGRDAQDVLTEEHGVTVADTSGLLTWLVEPADTTIGAPRRCFARHRARFDFAVVGAASAHAIDFDIEAGG